MSEEPTPNSAENTGNTARPVSENCYSVARNVAGDKEEQKEQRRPLSFALLEAFAPEEQTVVVDRFFGAAPEDVRGVTAERVVGRVRSGLIQCLCQMDELPESLFLQLRGLYTCLNKMAAVIEQRPEEAEALGQFAVQTLWFRQVYFHEGGILR